MASGTRSRSGRTVGTVRLQGTSPVDWLSDCTYTYIIYAIRNPRTHTRNQKAELIGRRRAPPPHPLSALSRHDGSRQQAARQSSTASGWTLSTHLTTGAGEGEGEGPGAGPGGGSLPAFHLRRAAHHIAESGSSALTLHQTSISCTPAASASRRRSYTCSSEIPFEQEGQTPIP
jgi:hypothetical protein